MKESLPTHEDVAKGRARANEPVEPPFEFCRSVKQTQFHAFSKTVIVTPLIAFAGVLEQACHEATALDDWHSLRRNTCTLPID